MESLMSSDHDRERHSKRLHAEEAKMKRQAKIAKSHGMIVDSPHKYAKMHAMNCGIPNCVMCANPRKIFGELTIQERRFDQKERGQDGNAAVC